MILLSLLVSLIFFFFFSCSVMATNKLEAYKGGIFAEYHLMSMVSISPAVVNSVEDIIHWIWVILGFKFNSEW